MLPDVIPYVPDPKNGRPIADGQLFFLLGDYTPPGSATDVNPAFIAEVTADGIAVPQPIFTSKGGTLLVGSQSNQPQLEVDPLVRRVAVYDKCGRLVYSTAYNGVGPFVSADALAADGSETLISGIPAFRIAARYKSLKNIMDYIPKSQHAAIRNHTSVYNCTADILAAIADYPANTGAIHFPAGLFISDPIDLRGKVNIAFIGANPASVYPYSNLGMTVIRANSVGDALINTATLDGDSYETGASTLIGTFENLLIDANNLTQVGITTARGIRVKGCTVQNAILDGITLESGFFPVWIESSFSRNNGRDGIRLKAPYSTLFSIRDTEASYNGGSGVTILDGSTGTLVGVTCQGNGEHGFGLFYNDPAGLANPIFLERLSFERCYTELNGGFGIYTDSYNTNPATYVGKITGLTFTNCSFNSNVGQNARLRGLANVQIINTLFLSDALDPAYNTVAIDTPTVQGASRPKYGLDLTLPTSGQIKFPATPNLSANANTLDAYQEGSFVPFIDGADSAGSATYTTQVGRYTRIGNRVFFSGELNWTAHTGTGLMRLQLGTFPYNNGGILETVQVRHSGFPVAGGGFSATCAVGGTVCLLATIDLSTGVTTLINVQAAGRIIFNGSFVVS